MTEISSIDEIEEQNRLNGLAGIWGALATQNENAVHVNSLDPKAADLIKRTEHIGLGLSPDLPHPSDPSLVGRVQLGNAEVSSALMSDLSGLTNELVEIEQNSLFAFPNIAWEAVKLGLDKERFTNEKINMHVKEAEKIQKDIDLLLDLQAEMSSLKDDAKEMSEKMREILDQLKNRGIDLWKDEGSSISKDQLSQIKSLTSSQIDALRSKLQIVFTTKIQVLIQTIGAIMETLKDIVRNQNRLISRVNQLTTGR